TLTGAVTAVFLVSNTLRYVFNWDPKYVGLVLSALVALYGSIMSADHNLGTFLIAIPNTAMIYLSAGGMASWSETTSKKRTKKRNTQKPTSKETNNRTEEVKVIPRRFLTPWFSA